MIILTLLTIAALGLTLLYRLYTILPRGVKPPPRAPDSTASFAVFLGSGGHTAEMRTLLAAVDHKRYTPRTYVYCHGDELSLRAVADTEATTSTATGRGATKSDYSLLALPRARRVGEGKASTLMSASKTLLVAVWATVVLPFLRRPSEPWADVLLLNGPGTAVVLVAAAYIRRMLGLKHTRIIYVESFARVTSLSLSGKLLRPFVDTFVVQWPGATGGDAVLEKKKGEPVRATYRGWLV